MNLLSFICFSRLYHAGNGRVYGPSEEVIGYVEQLGISNLSVSGNGGSLETFQWRRSCDKCQNKVVKGAGIFLGNVYVGSGQYPPRQRVLCVGCYVKHPKDDFPKSGKKSGGYREVDL